MHQHYFLFDYKGFQQTAAPLVSAADAGDARPVVEAATQVEQQAQKQPWLLEDLGTTLEGFETFLQEGLTAHITGFSFLLVLSRFLRPVTISDVALVNVSQVAASLGWEPNLVRLLSDGMATTNLLKPEWVQDPLERPDPQDERWYDPAYYVWWLRPENVYGVGWLNVEQIQQLHDRLQAAQVDFEHLDVSRLAVHPSMTTGRLKRNYEATLKLFSHALADEVGLFHVTV